MFPVRFEMLISRYCIYYAPVIKTAKNVSGTDEIDKHDFGANVKQKDNI